MNEKKILHDEAMDEDNERAFWFDGKNINEVLFCQHFLQLHPMKCVRGRLFTVDGVVEDEGEISQMILDEVRGCLTNGVAKAVSNLLAGLKLMAYSPPLPVETDRIHVANGTYFLNGIFTEDKTYCNNRLQVSYNPNAPQPERWLQFLSDLLVSEDIPTLQEYLGYCLIPSTKGQKMLILIGKGGEGKSRIGLVMRSILGDSMNTTSIQKIENNRFSRADLESKLLMVDDDMDMSALPKTNYIKSIVTAECKMDMERKGVQSYQSLLYARFLCFGNGALTALHDQSDGFFRRQIVLTTKDRPSDRMDDPFLAEKLDKLLVDVKLTNYKERTQQIIAFLDKYIPDIEQMDTELQKYKATFESADAEIKALEESNETMAEKLKKLQTESTIKKLKDNRLRQDYEDAKSILDRIPAEILRQYRSCANNQKQEIYR